MHLSQFQLHIHLSQLLIPVFQLFQLLMRSVAAGEKRGRAKLESWKQLDSSFTKINWDGVGDSLPKDDPVMRMQLRRAFLCVLVKLISAATVHMPSAEDTLELLSRWASLLWRSRPFPNLLTENSTVAEVVDSQYRIFLPGWYRDWGFDSRHLGALARCWWSVVRLV